MLATSPALLLFARLRGQGAPVKNDVWLHPVLFQRKGVLQDGFTDPLVNLQQLPLRLRRRRRPRRATTSVTVTLAIELLLTGALQCHQLQCVRIRCLV